MAREKALERAYRIGVEAAAVGFDWECANDALEKVAEEVEELRGAIDDGGKREQVEELGDLLFAVVNVARKLDVAPGRALEAASDKFRRRFARVREVLDERGRRPEDVGLDELERLWQQAKP